MSWKLLDRPKTQKVTKSLATNYASMEAAPHDRPLSERRLQVYARLLSEGQFRPVTWASAICRETGGLYRVNGKHTSALLSGLAVMPEFFVTVEEYECDTLEDVAKLYATFDSKMQSRSSSDINLSFAATVPELAGYGRNLVNLLVSGIAYQEWGPDAYGHQPAERAELLLEYTDFCVWSKELLDPGVNLKGSQHLRRMPVVAAMKACYGKAKSQAWDFWTAVRDETGSTPGVADRKLAKYLTSTSCIGGTRARRAKIASGNREVYVKCLHGWNAWRKGETTNLNYHAEAKVPSVA